MTANVISLSIAVK